MAHFYIKNVLATPVQAIVHFPFRSFCATKHNFLRQSQRLHFAVYNHTRDCFCEPAFSATILLSENVFAINKIIKCLFLSSYIKFNALRPLNTECQSKFMNLRAGALV